MVQDNGSKKFVVRTKVLCAGFVCPFPTFLLSIPVDCTIRSQPPTTPTQISSRYAPFFYEQRILDRKRFFVCVMFYILCLHCDFNRDDTIIWIDWICKNIPPENVTI